MNSEKIYLLNDSLYIEIANKINGEYQKKLLQKISTIISLYKLSSVVIHSKDSKQKDELIQKIQHLNSSLIIKTI